MNEIGGSPLQSVKNDSLSVGFRSLPGEEERSFIAEFLIKRIDGDRVLFLVRNKMCVTRWLL